MKRILVFGGTGAMGGYLVELLSSSGLYEIEVTSRSSHKSSLPRVRYIEGNARDNAFMQTMLDVHYDIVIDFMNYNYDEFERRYIALLSSCEQFIWFSSSRVYANSDSPLTESSPRLLEVTNDQAFLATNRYALRKARQEDLIKNSGFNNYTIIRPYITYSDARLQLGIYEKEQWLYRILKGRDLVVNKNILDKETTLTFGWDVSRVILNLVDNKEAMGKIVQIASSENMTWREVLDLYLGVLKSKRNIMPKIYASDDMWAIDELYEGGYNTIYDRVYNRHFDSSLAAHLFEGKTGDKMNYKNMRSGLKKCLSDFLDNGAKFLKIDWQYEAYQDLLTGGMAKREEFDSEEDWEIYNSYRKLPLSQIEGLGNKLELVN